MSLNEYIIMYFAVYMVFNTFMIGLVASHNGDSDLWMTMALVAFWPIGIPYMIVLLIKKKVTSYMYNQRKKMRMKEVAVGEQITGDEGQD